MSGVRTRERVIVILYAAFIIGAVGNAIAADTIGWRTMWAVVGVGFAVSGSLTYRAAKDRVNDAAR